MDHELQMRTQRAKLRECAEAALDSGQPGPDATEDARLLYELQVHQIELRMQNHELRRSQAELWASRQRYRQLFQAAPVAILSCQVDGRVLAANDMAGQLLGTDAADLVGAFLPAFSDAAALDDVHLFLRGLHDTSQVSSRVVRLVCGVRGVRDVLFDGHLEHTPGEEAAVLLCLSDVTAQKQAEARAAVLSQVIEQSPVSVMITDPDGVIGYVNPAFCLVTGFSAAEAIGSKPSLLKSGHHDEAFYQQMWQTILAGRPWRGDVRNRRKNGELYWELITIAPILGPTGQIIHFAAVRTDDTERHLAKQALAASEERFRTIAESAQDPIIGVDGDGQVQIWNPAAALVFGLDEAQARQHGIDQLISAPGRAAQAATDFRRCIQQGEGPLADHGVEVVATTARGDCLPMELSVNRVNKDGRWQATAILRDLSERRQREADQHQIAKLEALGILAGGIAHDFNNILTGVIANLSLARMLADGRAKTPPDELALLLREAEAAANRASTLTHQLLTFAKGGAPVKEHMTLPSLIRETAEFSLHGSQVQGEITIADELWPLVADEGQLGQVLQNLVINAIQAMADGGSLGIRADNRRLDDGDVADLPAGPYIRIAIQDTGGGIALEVLGRVFDPYFTTKPSGSGLGLATSFSIARQHGGIIVASSVLGQGTTMTVFLPALPGVGVAPVAALSPVTQTKTARVLLMDDEAPIRRLAKRILEMAGDDVTTVADGQQAVACFQRERDAGRPFDLVILDLTVPGGMGGLKTIAALRKIDPDLRAIVSSGYADDPAMADAGAYGFDGVAAKPYDVRSLRLTVQRVLAGGPQR